MAKMNLDDTQAMWENAPWSDESKADYWDATSLIMSGEKQTQHSAVKSITDARPAGVTVTVNSYRT